MTFNIDLAAFLEKFNAEYEFLYEAGAPGIYVAGYDEAVDAFDRFIKRHGEFVGKFADYRGDMVVSDREAAAFMFALDSFIE